MHGKEKDDRKQLSYRFRKVLLLLVGMTFCAVLLCSCYENRDKSEDTSFEKWKSEVKIHGRKGLRIKQLAQKEGNTIRVYAGCETEKGYAELSDVVNSHNNFIVDNKHLFPEDTSFMIAHDRGFGGTITYDFCFYSDLRDYYRTRDSSKQDTRDVGADLGVVNDGSIKYVEVNCLRCNEDKAFNNAVKYDVPVVILDLDGYGALNDGNLQMLNSFVGVKYVVVTHAADPAILSSAYNEITSTFSDVEVYLQSYDERGDKIFEKYQP